MSKSLKVSVSLHEDLIYLQDNIMRDGNGKRHKNITKVIRAVMDMAGFNERFFEYQREKVVE